jgi:hypothetical protein
MESLRRLSSDHEKAAAGDHDLVACSVTVAIGDADLLAIRKAQNDLIQRHRPITSAASSQPGGKGYLELGAAARALEPGANLSGLDDHDRGRRLDAQTGGQIGASFVVDAPERKSVVVPAAL